MAINPFVVGGGNTNTWNYSDPNKEGYTNTIQGTVVHITYRQTTDFNTKQPKFYSDGHPAMGFCVTIRDDAGTNYDWVFDAKTTSQAVIAIGTATGKQPGQPVNIMDIAGKFIAVHTPGLQSIKTKTGRQCTARIWQVQIQGEGHMPFEGTEQIDPAPYPGTQQQPVQQQPVQSVQQQPMQQQQPIVVQEPIQDMSQQRFMQQAQSNMQAAQQVSQQYQQQGSVVYAEDIPF